VWRKRPGHGRQTRELQSVGLAFEIWFNRPAPVDAMRAALLAVAK